VGEGQAPDFSGAVLRRSGSRPWTGAGTSITGAGPFTGATRRTTAGGSFDGAGVAHSRSSSFAGATAHVTDPGDFAGAGLGSGRAFPWSGASTAELLERAVDIQRQIARGETRRSWSVAGDGTLPRVVDQALEALDAVEQAATAARSPWAQTPYTPAHRARATAVAASRQASGPAVGDAIVRAAERMAAVSRALSAGAGTTSPVPRWSPVGPAQSLAQPFSGASSATTPDGDFDGAATGQARDRAWRGAALGSSAGGGFSGAASRRTGSGGFAGAGAWRTPETAWLGAGSVRGGSADFDGAGAWRTPDGTWQGAGSATTPAGSFTGAASRRAGSAGWMGAASARTGRGAFSGAGAWRTPEWAWLGAGTSTAGPGAFDGAPTGVGFDPGFTGAAFGSSLARDFAGARAGRTASGDFRGATTSAASVTGLAAARTGRTPAGDFRSARTARTAPSGTVVAGSTPARAGLRETLDGVAVEHAGQSAPGWAVRATGRTFLNTTGDLVQSLAEARDPLEIIQVILDRGDRLAVSRNLPTPVAEVIRQIRATAAQDMVPPRLAAQRAADASHSPSATVMRRRRAQSLPSTTRVVSGGASRGAPSMTAAGGVAGGKLKQLASRLQNLIHLVQVEGQLSDAQRQVRLAAEGAEASPMEDGEPGGARAAAKAGDLEALKREVLNSVSRELELRRERGQEDSDGNWW